MFAISSRTKFRLFASSTSGPQVGTLLARSDTHEFDLFLPSPARRIQGVSETVPDRSRKMSVEGHRSFLGRFIVTSLLLVRLTWATFSPALKIFLWKSPDRAEKILRMRATGRGKLRMFFAPKSISNKCSTAWRCTLKVCSPQRHA
jgi:hypothetical protein